MANEQVIGDLFVGHGYVRTYPAWEKSILSTLAAHASVAIGNARLFEQEQAALRQARETNHFLARQTAVPRVAAHAHLLLTPLAAQALHLSAFFTISSIILRLCFLFSVVR